MEAINGWLRPYQLKWLNDTSKYRCNVKGRQLGMTDAGIGKESVLTASGLLELMYPGQVRTADCLVISKDIKAAKKAIKEAKKWVRILELVPEFAPFVRLSTSNMEEIIFAHSGASIFALAQSPEAGRSVTANIWFDEFAFMRYQMEIWLGATPAITSDPKLRLSLISTPDSRVEMMYQIVHDRRKFSDWSVHKTSIYDAKAQGFDVDIEDLKRQRTEEQFQQEYMCMFVGSETTIFGINLLNESQQKAPPGEQPVLYFGIDAASRVDFTALVVIEDYPKAGVTLIGDTYILDRVPYKTPKIIPQGHKFHMGQDQALDALIRWLNPVSGRIDTTGDKGREVNRLEGLYKQLVRMRTPIKIMPFSYSQSWKNQNIPALKGALRSHELGFRMGRKAYVFSPDSATDYKAEAMHIRRIPDELINEFVTNCFDETAFDFLQSDFQKIYSKHSVRSNSVIYDATRDSTGHGDSFFAALLGWTWAKDRRLHAEVNSGRTKANQVMYSASGSWMQGLD